VTSQVLLERRILDITLKAPGTPVRFELYLEGADGTSAEASAPVPGAGLSPAIPMIYAAPMPFRFIADENNPGRDAVEFLLGEYPGNPFNTEILLPVDFSGYLRIQAVYAEWDGTIDTEPLPASPAKQPPPEYDYALKIIRRIPVGTGGTSSP
jgi:hypothetical protein